MDKKLLAKVTKGIQAVMGVGVTRQELLTSIEKIADYMQDEERHFNETDPADRAGHIWNDVLVLKRFLQMEKAAGDG